MSPKEIYETELRPIVDKMREICEENKFSYISIFDFGDQSGTRSAAITNNASTFMTMIGVLVAQESVEEMTRKIIELSDLIRQDKKLMKAAFPSIEKTKH